MEILKKNFILDTLSRVKKILPPEYRKKTFFIAFLLLLSSVLELLGLASLIPVLAVIFDDNFLEKYSMAASIYNFLGLSSDKQFIVLMATFLVVVMVSKNVLLTSINHAQNKYVFGIYKFISERLHRVYYQRGHEFLTSTNSNILQRDLITAPVQFASGILFMLINLLNEVVIVSFILIGIVLFNFKISILLALTVVPITMFFYSRAKNKIKEINDETKITLPYLNKQIFESIYGFQDIKILDVQEYFFDKIRETQTKVANINIIRTLFNYIPTRIIESGMMMAIALIIIYGIYFFDSKKEIVDLIGIFAIAGYRILPSLNRILTSALSIQSTIYTLEIVEQISDYKEPNSEDNTNKIEFNNDIHLSQIYFSFPGTEKTILKGIDLKIKKGNTIGIIGVSGSGKSTLMNLILGYLEPTKGEILLDGQSINHTNKKSVLEFMGYVSQDVYIIDSSLKENVAFGIPEDQIDFQKLNYVLKIAQLESFVKGLSNGVETIIGERGSSISGGQRQRVGIARALYSGAEILLFDEATSALDVNTEKEITDSIRDLNKENITSIMIAHRYSSLMHCDFVYELENGVLKLVDLKKIS
jgi:ATP-binding cassette, subfamily B, bacterial PglK